MALLRDESAWETFFKDAGIEEEYAKEYSKIFVENRMTEISLPELSSDILKSLKIQCIGDTMAIVQKAKSTSFTNTPTSTTTLPNQFSSSVNATASNAPTHTFKPPPASSSIPKITIEMTHAQFCKLRIDWSVYKEITQLPTDKVGVHLYDICEETVQNSIVNQHPKFFQLDEKEMLDAIESIVTKRINPAVHRSHFHQPLKQDYCSV